MATTASPPGVGSFINSISVTDLFGLYKYKLSASDLNVDDLANLLILYGDNGSGKTTILKLAFHLLSSSGSQGHRTYLARVPFREFSVHLGDNTVVRAERQRRLLIGSYRLTIEAQDRVPLKILVRAEPDGRVLAARNQSLPRFERRLGRLNLKLHYLSDDRRTEVSTVDEDEEVQLERRIVVDEQGQPREIPVRRTDILPQQLLDVSVRRLDTWIRAQALKASTQGEANTNTIYSEIIKRIGRTKGLEEPSETAQGGDLPAAMLDLEQRSRAFSEFNLVSPLEVSAILRTLNSAPLGTRKIMLNVLVPYVDGLKARLDALQGVQDLIRLFVETINSFLTNKTISFTLPEGMRITAKNDQPLAPNMLSSGERQLLLLFCNTITAREQASIFMIDEPELSLNVKWQRKLLESLLACSAGSSIQFLIATHSVELLSRHLGHVMRLTEEGDAGS